MDNTAIEVHKQKITDSLKDAIMFLESGYTTTSIICIRDALENIKILHRYQKETV
jgi:hypothetical protein